MSARNFAHAPLDWGAARQVDMVALAHRLGARLKQTGGFWSGPCPNSCASKDGFIVSPKKRLFYCRPSEEGGDAIEMVRHVQGCTKVEALAFITGDTAIARAERVAAPVVAAERVLAAASEMPKFDPMRSWRNAGPLARDCVGDLYFTRRRRIRLTDTERACLRFSHVQPHWPTRSRWPAILACVALATGEELTTHQTFLSHNGSDKAPLGDKARLFATGGRTIGGGVWFGKVDAHSELVIGEGIESTLSAMRIFNCVSGVAALSANGVRTLVLPESAGRVRIFADHDAAGQGLSAARDAARRWMAEGRTVALSMAEEPGADASDVWLKRQEP